MSHEAHRVTVMRRHVKLTFSASNHCSSVTPGGQGEAVCAGNPSVAIQRFETDAIELLGILVSVFDELGRSTVDLGLKCRRPMDGVLGDFLVWGLEVAVMFHP